MKILILDDDKQRLKHFRQEMIGHEVVCVETPSEAIDALLTQKLFDVVSLDHDLYGKVYQPSDEKSGFAVCQFLRLFAETAIPNLIICHSYNADGVKNMMDELDPLVADVGTTLRAELFASDEYWSLFPRTGAATA
jgi:CheY-like chemotaxis protein